MTALTIDRAVRQPVQSARSEMVDFYITLWDGKLQKATKTSGSDVIINPWVN